MSIENSPWKPYGDEDNFPPYDASDEIRDIVEEIREEQSSALTHEDFEMASARAAALEHASSLILSMAEYGELFTYDIDTDIHQLPASGTISIAPPLDQKIQDAQRRGRLLAAEDLLKALAPFRDLDRDERYLYYSPWPRSLAERKVRTNSSSNHQLTDDNHLTIFLPTRIRNLTVLLRYASGQNHPTRHIRVTSLLEDDEYSDKLQIIVDLKEQIDTTITNISERCHAAIMPIVGQESMGQLDYVFYMSMASQLKKLSDDIFFLSEHEGSDAVFPIDSPEFVRKMIVEAKRNLPLLKSAHTGDVEEVIERGQQTATDSLLRLLTPKNLSDHNDSEMYFPLSNTDGIKDYSTHTHTTDDGTIVKTFDTTLPNIEVIFHYSSRTDRYPKRYYRLKRHAR